MRARVRVLAAVAALAAALAGCGGSSSPAASGSAGRLHGTVVVFAAASLQEAFTAIAHGFQAAHPGVQVKLDFGGSDALAAGIVSGAPADVFAAASRSTMATVTRAGDALSAPVTFVRNTLEIALPPSNPRHIHSLADTTRPGVQLVLCAPAVPCGAAARTVYAAAHLTPHPASLEADVKAVLTKVELDEADAGLVYQTDVHAAGSKVLGLRFPAAAHAVNTYPIAVLRGSANVAAARAFLAYVLSASGQQALRAAGFLPA